MEKQNNKERIKVKTIIAKSKSLFGKTQMDKAIEKYSNEGWILAEKKKVRNEDKYTLEFRYVMSQEEIAKEDKFKRNRNIILGVIMFFCCGISYFQSQAIQRQQEADEATQVAINNTESVYATQTATLWTQTPTFTPTLTPTQTFTPSITPSPTITSTPSITPSSTITNTPVPTNTDNPTNIPAPTNLPASTSYYVQGSANVRDCPQTSCTLLYTYSAGTAIEIIDTNVIGEDVLTGTRWMEGVINGQLIYVHSSLVSLSRPAPTAIPQSFTNTNSSPVNTNSQVVAPVAPAGSDCTCSADTYNCTRESFSSIAEAQACHQKCLAEGQGDIHRLDFDDNGIICESGLN